MFGTDGIRTTVGSLPFTPEHLPRLGHALAQWAHEKYGTNPRIVIGHDTRISCAWVKASLKSSLLLYPVALFDADVLPTPAVCALVEKTDQYDLGIIISASHNPYHDNGIKLIDRMNGKLLPEDEDRICQLFDEQQLCNTYETLGTDTPLTTVHTFYTNVITSFFDTPFLTGKKIVLDCANGATSTYAQTIFERLGATMVAIHNRPNGTNINANCGALHPQDLQKKVLEHNADAGCAFDGDGDRIVMVNQYGTIMHGDELIALLSTHPDYAQQSTLVGTIMSNHHLATWLADQNKKLIRTAVGDKHVGKELVRNNLLLGGEPSGHVITRDYLSTGDGIFSALRILQTALLTNNWALTTFDVCPHVMINLPITQKKDLTLQPYADIIVAHEQSLPNGRIIVRYSGTESVLRVMVEDVDAAHAQHIGEKLAHILQEQLKNY